MVSAIELHRLTSGRGTPTSKEEEAPKKKEPSKLSKIHQAETGKNRSVGPAGVPTTLADSAERAIGRVGKSIIREATALGEGVGLLDKGSTAKLQEKALNEPAGAPTILTGPNADITSTESVGFKRLQQLGMGTNAAIMELGAAGNALNPFSADVTKDPKFQEAYKFWKGGSEEAKQFLNEQQKAGNKAATEGSLAVDLAVTGPLQAKSAVELFKKPEVVKGILESAVNTFPKFMKAVGVFSAPAVVTSNRPNEEAPVESLMQRGGDVGEAALYTAGGLGVLKGAQGAGRFVKNKISPDLYGQAVGTVREAARKDAIERVTTQYREAGKPINTPEFEKDVADTYTAMYADIGKDSYKVGQNIPTGLQGDELNQYLNKNYPNMEYPVSVKTPEQRADYIRGLEFKPTVASQTDSIRLKDIEAGLQTNSSAQYKIARENSRQASIAKFDEIMSSGMDETSLKRAIEGDYQLALGGLQKNIADTTKEIDDVTNSIKQMTDKGTAPTLEDAQRKVFDEFDSAFQAVREKSSKMFSEATKGMRFPVTRFQEAIDQSPVGTLIANRPEVKNILERQAGSIIAYDDVKKAQTVIGTIRRNMGGANYAANIDNVSELMKLEEELTNVFIDEVKATPSAAIKKKFEEFLKAEDYYKNIRSPLIGMVPNKNTNELIPSIGKQVATKGTVVNPEGAINEYVRKGTGTEAINYAKNLKQILSEAGKKQEDLTPAFAKKILTEVENTSGKSMREKLFNFRNKNYKGFLQEFPEVDTFLSTLEKSSAKGEELETLLKSYQDELTALTEKGGNFAQYAGKTDEEISKRVMSYVTSGKTTDLKRELADMTLSQQQHVISKAVSNIIREDLSKKATTTVAGGTQKLSGSLMKTLEEGTATRKAIEQYVPKEDLDAVYGILDLANRSENAVSGSGLVGGSQTAERINRSIRQNRFRGAVSRLLTAGGRGREGQGIAGLSFLSEVLNAVPNSGNEIAELFARPDVLRKALDIPESQVELFTKNLTDVREMILSGKKPSTVSDKTLPGISVLLNQLRESTSRYNQNEPE